MRNDQDQCRRAIINDRGRFSLAKDRESALKVGTALATISGSKVELYIIIGGGDVPEDFARPLGKRRAAKICVNNDAGPIDHRLNSTCGQFFNIGANQ